MLVISGYRFQPQVIIKDDPIQRQISPAFQYLPEIIKSVQSNLEKQIRESGTKFKINIGEKAVHFDSIRSYIQSVIYNIISNAIKYAKDGVNPIISLSANKVNDHLTIEISDNGIGMDMTKISSQLFGLYKKFNFSKEGRGPGLHMTKTQIESLGGSIEVKSRVGEGSTFTISLPA